YISIRADRAGHQLARRHEGARDSVHDILPDGIVIEVLAEIIRASQVEIDQSAVIKRLAARGIGVTAPQLNQLCIRLALEKNTGFCAVKLLRQYIHRVVFNLSLRNLFFQRPALFFRHEHPVCPCGKRLTVLKTYPRSLASLAIGEFHAHITQLACSHCKKTFDSEELQTFAPPKGKFCFDVMTHVGEALFLRSCNGKEIQYNLSEKNINISLREIDRLGRRFIVYLALAHEESQGKIKALMWLRGGYILHLDGTCEGDSPCLITTIDALSRIVLDNIKLPSENADQLIPFLKKIKLAYGDPIAMVHDMGGAILKAVREVFPKTPDYICHFHFLKDIGKDLFGCDYAAIRRHLKTHAVRSHLRKAAKSLRKAIDADSESRDCLHHYLESKSLNEPETPLTPLATAYLIISWVLEARQNSHGFGFPFDRPHFDLCLRLGEACPDLQTLKSKMADNASLLPLMPISKVLTDKALAGTVQQMQDKIRIFDQLRAAMRITQPDSCNGLNDDGDLDIATIKERVTRFRYSGEIKELAESNTAYRKMVRQIDKYWDKLFADPIQILTPTGTVTILPQRTNNILEQFFRDLKRIDRKRNGSHALTKTLKTMLAQTPLVKNLDNPQYMEIILNGKASLAERFAEIDIAQVRKAHAEAQKSTQRYPKRMAEVFKIPHLPSKLVKIPSKKAAAS
ncbi:MAG: transposase, partial [Gammaproteobacteria bacterium]|nr:transposase [Gammaproteobacteria bacterium]